MFKSIDLFGKTVENTWTYTLPEFSYEQAKGFLTSIPDSSMIFGVEHLVSHTQTKTQLFSQQPFMTDLMLKEVRNPYIPIYEPQGLLCVHVSSNKSSCFPFRMDSYSFWEMLNETLGNVLKDGHAVYFQLLFQKRSTKHWKREMSKQYYDYLQGIEFPTSVRAVRYLQYKLLDLAKKFDPVKNNHPIPECEHKLSQDGFRYCFRFIVLGKPDGYDRIISRINNALMQTSHFNKFVISEDEKFGTFMENVNLRLIPRFHPLYQVMCTKEVVPFFLTKEFEEEHVPEQIAIVETEVVEQVEDDYVFSIFPKGEKKEHKNDIHLAQKLNQSLRKLSLLQGQDVIIQKIQHGATLQKIVFSLPTGLKLSDLIRRKADIQTELALNDISFEQGNEAGTVALTIPQEDREMVFVRDCVESDEFQEIIKKAELPLLFGMNEVGKVEFECLTTIKHLLIVGSTGSGKSVFLNSLLLLLITLKNPSDLKFIMIDPKMVELKCFRDFPHVLNVFTNMDEAVGALGYAVEQMERRYELFEKADCRNIQQYNRKFNDKLPYLIVVIDELADLIMTHPQVEELIIRLAQKARAAGMHLIIATQRPQKEVVTGLIKANIYSRVCFACDSGYSYRIALDETLKFTLLGKGDGVYRVEGKQGLHRFQGAVIADSEEKQDEIIKKMARHWKDEKREAIDVTVIKQKMLNDELNKFKKIVLEGETRITEIQKLLNVRTEKVKQYMDELIELGWIVKHKSRARGYELVLSVEERKKYLVEM